MSNYTNFIFNVENDLFSGVFGDQTDCNPQQMIILLQTLKGVVYSIQTDTIAVAVTKKALLDAVETDTWFGKKTALYSLTYRTVGGQKLVFVTIIPKVQ